MLHIKYHYVNTDKYSSLLTLININSTKILQSVLHSAARLIMRKRNFDSITPTIRDDLHWLPLPQKIDYKLCMIIYRCLHQTGTHKSWRYTGAVSTTASRRHLRSAARGDLQVLATKTVTFGPRSFALSAPKLWNSLPLPLRDSTLTLRQFGSRLKTHLFSLAYGCASWLIAYKGCAI